jgi:hypothetical protein
METTNPASSWVLILVFTFASAVSSLVAGHYSSEASCKEASNTAQMQPRSSGVDIMALCVPGE